MKGSANATRPTPNPEHPTGFPRHPEVQGQGESPEETTAGGRPLVLAWITDELIEEHQRIWSRMYRRVITEEEAVEIIMNIRRFAETVLESVAGEKGDAA